MAVQCTGDLFLTRSFVFLSMLAYVRCQLFVSSRCFLRALALPNDLSLTCGVVWCGILSYPRGADCVRAPRRQELGGDQESGAGVPQHPPRRRGACAAPGCTIALYLLLKCTSSTWCTRRERRTTSTLVISCFAVLCSALCPPYSRCCRYHVSSINAPRAPDRS